MVGWTRFRKTYNSRVFINKISYLGGPRQARHRGTLSGFDYH